MKNTQKKKITWNYHLLTKGECGKCRRVTVAIDVTCINGGGIQTNAQIGKQFFSPRKRLVEQCYVIFHKWWSLKNKNFPNRHTVLATVWSELWGHDWIPSRWLPEGHCRLTFLRLDVTNDINYKQIFLHHCYSSHSFIPVIRATQHWRG